MGGAGWGAAASVGVAGCVLTGGLTGAAFVAGVVLRAAGCVAMAGTALAG